ncbi:LmeA family phospholipid-binding protein [Limnospira platensis]|uniref:LmeA family phospholipid-binding protein n=1 Tax=Limnospira platensis TaxID=118562 RepID=UPI003D6FE197
MTGTKTEQKKLIGTVLSAALQLWLRSQVEGVESLKVHVGGGNRSLLKGSIPTVSVSARAVIYQGLHLSQVVLGSSGIRINLGQVLQGKPLQLLEAIEVDCDLQILASDLNAWVSSPLLANAITELLESRLPLTEGTLENLQLRLNSDRLTLNADLITDTHGAIAFSLDSQLQRMSSTQLLLHQPYIKADPLISGTVLESIPIELGTDVDIEDLSISEEQLTLRGKIWVNP